MPYVQITEQPTSVGVRFRYPCEGRSAGCIRGVQSTEQHKSYPTVKVFDYQGPATCVVSCVTKDGPPYFPHPHKLVGKHAANGVCFQEISTPDMTFSFPNVGIQCVKKTDIKESLSERQKLQIDPFATGFSHSASPNKINLSCLRLCFQVFIPDSSGKICVPLEPVISDVIYDNKAVSTLGIVKLSHCSAPVIGGQEIILLCDQVNKGDIEVVFYEERLGKVIWSANGEFSPHDVHRKFAISLTVPPYKCSNISHAVEVFVRLRCPSDGTMGKPRSFTYVPLKLDPDGILRKKQKYDMLRTDKILDFIIPDDQIAVPRIIKKAVRTRTKSDYMAMDENLNVDHKVFEPQTTSVHCEGMQEFLPPSYHETQASNSILYSSVMNFCMPSTSGMQTFHQENPLKVVTSSQNNNSICEGLSTNTGNERLENDFAFNMSDLDVSISDLNLETFCDNPIVNLSLSSSDLKCYPEA